MQGHTDLPSTTAKREALRYLLSWERVDWPWHQALGIFKAKQRPNRHLEDPQTLRAYDYLWRLSRCRTKQQRQFVIQRYPSLHRARWLYEYGGWQRTVLEARLLSGQPVADVARKLCLTEGVVNSYEKVFFDWRHKKDATDWIMARVIQFPSSRSEPRTVSQVLKHQAFFGGPFVAEALIAVILKEMGILTGTMLPQKTERLCRRLLKVEMLPLNDKTLGKLLQDHKRLLVAEQRMTSTALQATVPAPDLQLEPFTTALVAAVSQLPRTKDRLVNHEGQDEPAVEVA